MAQSALLKQTMPLFVPIVAFFWMGERFLRLLIMDLVKKVKQRCAV